VTRQAFFNYTIGLAGMAVSLFFLWRRWPDAVVITAVVFLLVIVLTDMVRSKIPNVATVLLVLTGFTFNGLHAGLSGIRFSLLGLLVGLGLLLIPYLMKGMGAGDVKAMGALGALLGPAAIFQVFLYTAVVGGGLAILYYLVAGQLTARLNAWRVALFTFMATKDRTLLKPVPVGKRIKFPYAAAIALGYGAFLYWGAFFEH